jgi:hypothetical protein
VGAAVRSFRGGEILRPNSSISLSKEVFDTDRGLWLATSQNELYPNPHSYAKEGENGEEQSGGAGSDSLT